MRRREVYRTVAVPSDVSGSEKRTMATKTKKCWRSILEMVTRRKKF